MSGVGRGGGGPTQIQGNLVAAVVFICDNFRGRNDHGKLSQIIARNLSV